MVWHVVDALREAGLERIVVVAGAEPDALRSALGGVELVVQTQQLGTAHAVEQAKSVAADADQIMVLNGDVPLITAETLGELRRIHEQERADLTFVTAEFSDAGEYGVVQRDSDGNVASLIEAKDRGSHTEGPAEINGGQYAFRAGWLWSHLPEVRPSEKSGERYLTTLVGIAVEEGASIASVRAMAEEVGGVNDRVQLAEVERLLRERINASHMRDGVTFVDPTTAYVDADVKIGQDTIIEPNVFLRGASTIGRATRIGSNSIVSDSRIGDRCRLLSSTVEHSILEDDVEVGPYSHLRPGAYLSAGVHVGNFAEIKNARLGPGVKMGHMSYLGDAEVGEGTNIGAGTITCNFDGESKHRTVIGRNAFIGSDTMLVAPVSLGDGARTGAGSVVTKDVPAGAVAIGAPARVMRGTEAPS
jgi:bifunctional UDP-N-acetylglucosamine pyrophosphorylase/glucosamine-1-phosphate N-acetyltransferase